MIYIGPLVLTLFLPLPPPSSVGLPGVASPPKVVQKPLPAPAPLSENSGQDHSEHPRYIQRAGQFLAPAGGGENRKKKARK